MTLPHGAHSAAGGRLISILLRTHISLEPPTCERVRHMLMRAGLGPTNRGVIIPDSI